MSVACGCARAHPRRLVVLTGGPGAGKTAVLEVARRELCEHVVVVPEAASILWLGGFPRRPSFAARCGAQRAIAHLQIEMQRMTLEEGGTALVLCDRGTLDGLAYWPGEPEAYLASLETTRERELARYATVIQMRPPTIAHGYRTDDVRTETADQAAAIDARIERAWAGHPRHFVVESEVDFLAKLRHTLGLIRDEVPTCCRSPAG